MNVQITSVVGLALTLTRVGFGGGCLPAPRVLIGPNTPLPFSLCRSPPEALCLPVPVSLDLPPEMPLPAPLCSSSFFLDSTLPLFRVMTLFLWGASSIIFPKRVFCFFFQVQFHPEVWRVRSLTHESGVGGPTAAHCGGHHPG